MMMLLGNICLLLHIHKENGENNTKPSLINNIRLKPLNIEQVGINGSNRRNVVIRIDY